MKDNKNTDTKSNKVKEIKFSVAFKKDGESFQNVMEKILMSKIAKK